MYSMTHWLIATVLATFATTAYSAEPKPYDLPCSFWAEQGFMARLYALPDITTAQDMRDRQLGLTESPQTRDIREPMLKVGEHAMLYPQPPIWKTLTWSYRDHALDYEQTVLRLCKDGLYP